MQKEYIFLGPIELSKKVKDIIDTIIGMPDDDLYIYTNLDSIVPFGPICTKKQLEQFGPSTAHLNASGRIMCFGTQVGTREDIIFK